MHPYFVSLQSALELLGVLNVFHNFEGFNDEELDVLARLERLALASSFIHFRRHMDWLSFENRDWSAKMVEKEVASGLKTIQDAAWTRLCDKMRAARATKIKALQPVVTQLSPLPDLCEGGGS